MVRARIGKRPPRYAFMLNPHTGTRLSKCPKCEKPTHSRKFALFIHIDDWGPMALGVTCRYCTPCELIMAHQEELEAQLAYNFSRLAPNVIGNEYMVLGTIEKKVWQEGLGGQGPALGDMLNYVADFKRHDDLEFQPGGWYPEEYGPRKKRSPG